jgi:hypothetical protein
MQRHSNGPPTCTWTVVNVKSSMAFLGSFSSNPSAGTAGVASGSAGQPDRGSARTPRLCSEAARKYTSLRSARQYGLLSRRAICSLDCGEGLETLAYLLEQLRSLSDFSLSKLSTVDVWPYYALSAQRRGQGKQKGDYVLLHCDSLRH